MLEENCYLDPIVDRSNILEKNISIFIFLLFMVVGFIVPCQCCFSLQCYQKIVHCVSIFIFYFLKTCFSDFQISIGINETDGIN